MRVVSQPPQRGGAFAPAELFDPQDFLAALSPEIQVEHIHQPHPMGMLP